MKIQEIAERISAHLRRMETDPVINKPDPTFHVRPYFMARAWGAGSRVGILYTSYQGEDFLTKKQAETYLAWLDAGHNGRHYPALGQGAA